MKAKAAVLYQYDTRLVVEEVEVASPEQGKVLANLGLRADRHLLPPKNPP